MAINYHNHNISTSGTFTASSGNFTTLVINGSGVSVGGHSHTSSDITNFNSGVSGLLPTIANSGDNRILTSTGSTVGINAESNLTYDGYVLRIGQANNPGQIMLYNNDSNDSATRLSLNDYFGNARLYIESNDDGDQNTIYSYQYPLDIISYPDFLRLYGPAANYILLSTSSTIDMSANSGVSVSDCNFRIDNQTASTIASFDSSKNLVSLSTTTYPSLTELSYIKGITSTIQTQLNGKASTGHMHTSSDITDFNSAVSGLLTVKNIVAGTGISISSSNGSFTINATSTGGGGGAGGISNLIEDTTPQLGGNLDLNNYSITGNKFQTTSSGTIIGHSGWIYQNNQNVISNGSFGVASGDAQYSTYLLRTISTTASWNTLLNNGQSGILLASNRTFQFTANIVARRTDAKDNAAYKLEGFLSNDGFGCDIIGTPTKTVFGESDSSWDVQAIISNSGNSNYLFIQGYGATSKTINWLAKVDILEVGGNIPSYTESNILNIPNFFIP